MRSERAPKELRKSSERAPKFGPNLPESSRPLSRPARSVVPLGATVVPLGAPVSSRSVPAKHTCRVLSARSLARILPSSPAFHVPKPACGSQRPRTTVSTRHGVPRPARAGMWRCQFCAATTVALVRTALTRCAILLHTPVRCRSPPPWPKPRPDLLRFQYV